MPWCSGFLVVLGGRGEFSCVFSILPGISPFCPWNLSLLAFIASLFFILSLILKSKFPWAQIWLSSFLCMFSVSERSSVSRPSQDPLRQVIPINGGNLYYCPPPQRRKVLLDISLDYHSFSNSKCLILMPTCSVNDAFFPWNLPKALVQSVLLEQDTHIPTSLCCAKPWIKTRGLGALQRLRHHPEAWLKHKLLDPTCLQVWDGAENLRF